MAASYLERSLDNLLKSFFDFMLSTNIGPPHFGRFQKNFSHCCRASFLEGKEYVHFINFKEGFLRGPGPTTFAHVGRDSIAVRAWRLEI